MAQKNTSLNLQNKKAIIFFTRIPIKGRCKTRLFEFLKEEGANNLQISLIKSNFNVISQTNIKIFVFHSNDGDIKILKDIIGDKLDYHLQNGNDLGEKMSNAFKKVFSLGYKNIILLGSDLVNLKAKYLNNAFAKLLEKDIVISKTYDGGYGLIGMKKPCENIFDLNNFGSNNVYKNTISLIKKENLTFYNLPTIRDIDTKEDIFEYITNSKITFLASGEYNANYLYTKDSKTFIFRVKYGSQLQNIGNPSKYEYEALKLLKHTNITPKVYTFYEKNKFLPLGAFSMEFLQGRALDYDKDLNIAAFLLAKIHNTNIPNNCNLIYAKKPFLDIYKECQYMASFYLRNESADKKVVKYLNWFFDECSKLNLDEKITNECIINTELNNTNFIINDKSDSYVIDWEKPIIGECEQDIAHFLTPTTTFFRTDTILSMEKINCFLAEYKKYRNFDIFKFNKYLKFMILRGLSWCSMAKIEYKNARNIGNVKEKIDSYLSEDFFKKMQKYYLEY